MLERVGMVQQVHSIFVVFGYKVRHASVMYVLGVVEVFIYAVALIHVHWSEPEMLLYDQPLHETPPFNAMR